MADLIGENNEIVSLQREIKERISKLRRKTRGPLGNWAREALIDAIGIDTRRPRVGAAVIIVRDGKLLLHRRKGWHGHGQWSLLGGHVEHGASVVDTAIAEAKEEGGVDLVDAEEIGVYTRCQFDSEKDYFTHYVAAEIGDQEPRIMEPDKCSAIGWFDRDQVTRMLNEDELFAPFRLFVESHDAWLP